LKKLTISALVIGSLVLMPTFASAATKSPKPKVSGMAAAGGEEGSASHEAGEGKKVEKKETGNHKKKVIKKKK
jgi:hypothetical protein